MPPPDGEALPPLNPPPRAPPLLRGPAQLPPPLLRGALRGPAPLYRSLPPLFRPQTLPPLLLELSLRL